jgi:hypothetical protein
MTSTALFESGVLVPNPIVDAQLAQGGDIFNVPAWLDLAATNDPGGAEPNFGNDNPAVSATPKKITAVNHVCRKSYLNDSWSASDFATELAGSNPQQRVTNQMVFTPLLARRPGPGPQRDTQGRPRRPIRRGRDRGVQE